MTSSNELEAPIEIQPKQSTRATGQQEPIFTKSFFSFRKNELAQVSYLGLVVEYAVGRIHKNLRLSFLNDCVSSGLPSHVAPPKKRMRRRVKDSILMVSAANSWPPRLRTASLSNCRIPIPNTIARRG